MKFLLSVTCGVEDVDAPQEAVAATPLRAAPERPGNYHVRYADGRRVGVATVKHFGAGMVSFFIRTPLGYGPRVQTDEVRVEFERQDEAWAAVLDAFGKALELDANALVHEG